MGRPVRNLHKNRTALVDGPRCSVHVLFMRIIHTADWQIGKPFRNFGEKESVLRQARLTAIETIGKLAANEAAQHVLIAGDLYDTESPSQKTLLEPLERMRGFPGVEWHVIPGNHDPHRGQGLWDRVRTAGLPPNVNVHLTPEPSPLGAEAVLLPAPMRRKSEASDLTEWMDTAATGPGLIRIGLAHGSITGFDSGGEANNPIAPDRAKRAGLDYLALGDWHRTMQVGPATWYAGTPETDRFNSQELGQVLLVEIAGPGSPPIVSTRRTGTYRWLSLGEEITHRSDLDGLQARIRNLPDLSSLLARLQVKGTLDLTARADLSQRLSVIEAAMFWLETDLSELHVRPTLSDLEQIDFGGVLREAAEMLKAEAEDPASSPVQRRRAEEALVQLFLMTRNDANGAAA
jgi:DNA repair exonuclease SbcCD nuclease subunit